MLRTLTVKNYALIEDLNIDFSDGFTTITGETGAGKSILLGALSMVLGARADSSLLRDASSKGVMEAAFDIEKYKLQKLFEKEDLDYEPISILRREILTNGKSRAFVNDTPVTLNVLASIGSRLVDIHSQHEVLLLTQQNFQFTIIDAVAGNANRISEYKIALGNYRKSLKKLEELKVKLEKATRDLEYNRFQFEELEKARLKEGILEELEQEYASLANVESIVEAFSFTQSVLQQEEAGMMDKLSEVKQKLYKVKDFHKDFQSLSDRITSMQIELSDISLTVDEILENAEQDPEKFQNLENHLSLINSLMTKHGTDSEIELMKIKETLSDYIGQAETGSMDLEALTKEVEQLRKDTERKAQEVHNNRLNAVPTLCKKVENLLAGLGMSSARFKVEIVEDNEFNNYGKDKLEFLLAANKGVDFSSLKKAASGGELSRIMLSIKCILSQYQNMPTLIFDEIDTGVSGEISNAMGAMMAEMANHMQVLAITHLPQVAAKGHQQLKVYKYEEQGSTKTSLVPLESSERIKELAAMLGGRNLSESAILHAKELLGL